LRGSAAAAPYRPPARTATGGVDPVARRRTRAGRTRLVAARAPARRGLGGDGNLAGVRPGRRAHAVHLAAYRAPLRLGQPQPVVVQSAVPAAAPGRMPRRAGWRRRHGVADRVGDRRPPGAAVTFPAVDSAAVATQWPLDRA